MMWVGLLFKRLKVTQNISCVFTHDWPLTGIQDHNQLPTILKLKIPNLQMFFVNLAPELIGSQGLLESEVRLLTDWVCKRRKNVHSAAVIRVLRLLPWAYTRTILRTDTVFPSQARRYFELLPKCFWRRECGSVPREENIEGKDADALIVPITVGKWGWTGRMTWSLPTNYFLPFGSVCFTLGS